MDKSRNTEWAPDDIRCLILYINSKLCIKCKECGKIRQTAGRKSIQEKIAAGKNVKFCKDCQDNLLLGVKKISPAEATKIGVIIDQKSYYKDNGNLFVKKFCAECLEWKPVRVSSLLDSLKLGKVYRNRCKECSYTGKIINSNGYAMVMKKGHPFSDKSGYILEHRYVMEQSIGRYLYTHETVHHKNGNKLDNRIENLQLRSSQHGQGISVSCADCGSINLKYNEI